MNTHTKFDKNKPHSLFLSLGEIDRGWNLIVVDGSGLPEHSHGLFVSSHSQQPAGTLRDQPEQSVLQTRYRLTIQLDGF